MSGNAGRQDLLMSGAVAWHAAAPARLVSTSVTARWATAAAGATVDVGAAPGRVRRLALRMTRTDPHHQRRGEK